MRQRILFRPDCSAAVLAPKAHTACLEVQSHRMVVVCAVRIRADEIVVEESVGSGDVTFQGTAVWCAELAVQRMLGRVFEIQCVASNSSRG